MGRDYGGHPDDVPLLAASRYVYARTAKDGLWGALYAVAIILAVAGGAYGFVHRNPHFSKQFSPSYLGPAHHCPAAPAGPARRLLADDADKFDPSLFLEASGLVVGVSVAGGLLIGLLALLLFKHRPHGMVLFTVGLQVAVPAGMAATAFLAGATGVGFTFAFFAGILALTFWLYREQLALVGRLLALSARALTEVPSIVVASLGLQAAGLVLVLPLLACMFAAFTNGSVAPNPAVDSVLDDGTCAAADGTPALCCTWAPDPWVPWYLAGAALALTWTSLLVFCVRLFTVSGATAQWYFAPAGQPGALRGVVVRSLRHALGPSFGSLALGSWVLTLIQLARQALENIRQQAAENGGGLCVQLLASCMDALYALLQQLTKFGVVLMAITGEGFFDACGSATTLLARNLLDTVGVWWFPGMVLQCAAFILSAAWGVLAFGASTTLWGGGRLAWQSGAVVGGVAFLCSLLTISFINGVLLNVVDAVYLCYALDRDAHCVTMASVHQLYAQLPSVKGGVVEQPDGNYAFGGGGAGGMSRPAQPAPYPQAGGGAQAYAAPTVYPSISHV